MTTVTQPQPVLDNDAQTSFIPRLKRYPRLLAGLIWVIFLLLYSLTAAPSISELFSDTLELQLVAPTFAIAHPTGYPLYTLLGGVWSRLLFPVGNWAWRMNLFSALAGATAIALLALLANRLTQVDEKQFTMPWAALAFGLIPVWWQQSTISEVYALHLVFVASILLVTLALGSKGEGKQTDYGRTPALLCFLIGLSLTHHRTSVLLLPGVLIYLLWAAPALFRPQRAWFVWALALLAPLLLYAYLPIRAAQGASDLHGDYVNSWNGFVRHVLALGYTGFFSANSLGQERSWGDWLALFQVQMGGWVLGAALLGLIVAFARPQVATGRKAWLLISLVFVVNLLFALNYKVGDVEVFLLPVFLCIALFFHAGVAWLLAWLKGWKPAQVAVALLLVSLLLWQADWRSALQQAANWSVHNYAVAMAKTAFPAGSQVIGLEGEMTALRYMQASERIGLDAQPIVADDEEKRRTLVAQSIADGHATYLTRELPGIEDQYSFSSEGVLVRVWPPGQVEISSPQHPLDLDWAEGALKLTGYSLQRLDQPGELAWQLILDWQVQRPIQKSLKLSLRWLDANGETLFWPNGNQGQDEFPLRQVSQTNHWRAGEKIQDTHIVEVPDELAAHIHSLQVILYDAANGNEAGRWQVELPK